MGGSRQVGLTSGVDTPRSAPTDRVDGEDALAVLFDSDYRTLVAAARFIVDDRETAEDVVMEAFVGLHRRWSGLRDRGEAHRYLRSSVLNGARSQLRRRRVRRLNEARSTEEPVGAGDVAARGADHVTLVTGLRHLADRQREVLVMRFFLGMTEAEVADELGISVGSVKQHSARGLAALADVLEGTR